MFFPVPVLDALEAQGFENLAIATHPASTTVWFEDRRSLDPVDGMGQILRALDRDTSDLENLTLIVCWRGLPQLGVTLRLADWHAFRQGRTDAGPFARSLSFDLRPPAPPAPRNATAGRVDWQIVPGYYYSDRFEAFLNQDITVQGGPGWEGLARLRVGLVPDLSLKPWSAALRRRTFPSGGQTLAMLGGWTSPLGTGVSAEWAGLLDEGNLLWSLTGGAWTDRNPALVGQLEWRMPWQDAFLRGGGGRYPAGDLTAFVEAGRLFPRSLLAVGVFRSETATQFRASIATYLGGEQRPDPGPLRVEPGGWFGADYRATAPGIGSWPGPVPDALGPWTRMNPARIRRLVSRWLPPHS